MARRRKAYFSDLMMQNVEYTAFSRVCDSKGNRGTRYVLSEPMAKEVKEYFEKFENVKFGKAHYRYAPEIVHDTLILLDKIPKEKTEMPFTKV